MQGTHDVAIEAVKIAPPAAVVGTHYILGMSLNDWVLVLTIIYLLAQLGLLVPRYRAQLAQWWAKRREGRKCQPGRE